MPSYSTADIRNITLVGHGGAGKTSLCEAFLHSTGVTTRLGSVSDKTSHLDTDDEAKERLCSVDSHVLYINAEGKTLNIIDTPGAPDFVGPAIASLMAVETAVIVINAAAGVQVNTRRLNGIAQAQGLARLVVVNRMDSEGVAFDDLLKALRETIGNEVVPVNLPAGKCKSVVNCITNAGGDTDFYSVAEAHKDIVERVAEVDDALLNKYFEQGELSAEEVQENLPKAIAAGNIIPLLFTNARGNVGIKELLAFVAKECPSPIEGKQRMLKVGDKETQLKLDGPFVGQAFKVANDPKSGIRYCFIRTFSGSLKPDGNLVHPGEKKGARPGHLLRFQGHDHKDVDLAIAGDIFAVSKTEFHIGETLFDGHGEGDIPKVKFPTPMYSLAVEPKARGDEAKIGDAVRRFSDVDPCFKAHHDGQTHELVVSGVGDLHLRVILSKMHRLFKIDVNTKPPKIPYRETISMGAEGHHRHKKQTGGAGQFGEVFLRVDPLPRGSEPPMQWAWDIFGGSIPGQFESAIKKGVVELLGQGALAGFPLQDIKVSITDGKHHPVDSKEVAFKTAGKLAFRDAVLKAKPVLLEPIVNIEVTVPADNVGDITGDLAQRRGRPSGQDMLPGNLAVIKAQVPLAKVADYHSRLSSITGGKGSFAMDLSHFEAVPSNEAAAIIAQYKPKKEEDE